VGVRRIYGLVGQVARARVCTFWLGVFAPTGFRHPPRRPASKLEMLRVQRPLPADKPAVGVPQKGDLFGVPLAALAPSVWGVADFVVALPQVGAER
jgi:hypothetical protein